MFDLSQYGYFILFIQNYAGPLSQLNGGVYWSIAVEEHFYIVAPFLLVASVHFKSYRVHILLLLILLPPLIRLGIYEILVRGDMRKFYDYIYFPTHARFDNLALGVFCAYVCAFHRDVLQHPLFRQILPVAAVLLLFAAVFTTASLNRYSQHPSLIAGVLGFCSQLRFGQRFCSAAKRSGSSTASVKAQ